MSTVHSLISVIVHLLIHYSVVLFSLSFFFIFFISVMTLWGHKHFVCTSTLIRHAPIKCIMKRWFLWKILSSWLWMSQTFYYLFEQFFFFPQGGDAHLVTLKKNKNWENGFELFWIFSNPHSVKSTHTVI